MTMPTLKDGDVLIFAPDDLGGKIVTSLEADSPVSHACMYFLGEIHSTGVGPFATYGTEPAWHYLIGRKYAVARWDTLTPREIDAMEAASEKLFGQPYGWWKLPLLKLKSDLGGVVTKLTPFTPNNTSIHSPFCSQAVTYCNWSVSPRPEGLPRGPNGLCRCEPWLKLDTASVTPQNLLEYAMEKATDLSIVWQNIY